MRRELRTRDWDLIVIGAGPAGAVAAREAASRGLHTLLVEAKRFPRDKVCGCCLNVRALQILEQVGSGHLLDQGIPLRSLQVHSSGRRLDLTLPHGVALSRRRLDDGLVQAAISSGVTFLDETTVCVHPEPESESRRLTLTHHGENRIVRARAVLVADGLLRSSVRNLPQFSSRIARRSYLGAGATFEDDSTCFPPGRITMSVGESGYVGLTRLENGMLNVAAAFSPASVKQAAALHVLAATIIRACGLPLPGSIEAAAWHGTPMLTSQPGVVAAERIFLIGDSAGYVEPFTGEGIASALESGIAVMPFVAKAVQSWDGRLMTDWTKEYQRTLRNRQWISRTLAALLRNPGAVTLMMQGCYWLPAVPQFLIRKINHPGKLTGSMTQGCL